MGIVKPPNRNLGAGENWGRWMEDQIRGAQVSSDQQFQSINRSLKDISSSLDYIAKTSVRDREQLQTYNWGETLDLGGLGGVQSFEAPEWATKVIILTTPNITKVNFSGNSGAFLVFNSVKTSNPPSWGSSNPMTDYSAQGYLGSGSAQSNYVPQTLTLGIGTSTIYSRLQTYAGSGGSGKMEFSITNTYIFS